MNRIERRRQRFFEKYKRTKYSPGDYARRIILERERKRVPVYPIPLAKWYKEVLEGEWKSSATKVPFYCNLHGYFYKRIRTLLKKFGCQYCSGTAKIDFHMFIKRARKIHGNKFTYMPNYWSNVKDKIHMLCNDCGYVFWTIIDNHINSKRSCPSCGGKLKVDFETFIKRAREIHGNKYTYMPNYWNYVKDKIHILCNECGCIFWQEVNKHINIKQGCPNCAGALKIDFQTFIKRAREVHGNKYTYMPNYWNNVDEKIHILCNECGHIFWQSITSHLNAKHGCSNCAKSQQTSKPEKEIAQWLESFGFNVERNVQGLLKNKNLEVDIWIPEKRVAIEFNGIYLHRAEKKGKHYHKDKTLSALESGIQLLHVFEDQWNDNRKRIENAILFALGIGKLPFWPYAEEEIEIDANLNMGCWLRNFGYVVDRWTEPCYIETSRGGYYDSGRIVWKKNENVKDFWVEGI